MGTALTPKLLLEGVQMLFGPQGGDSASVQEDGALPLGDDRSFHLLSRCPLCGRAPPFRPLGCRFESKHHTYGFFLLLLSFLRQRIKIDCASRHKSQHTLIIYLPHGRRNGGLPSGTNPRRKGPFPSLRGCCLFRQRIGVYGDRSWMWSRSSPQTSAPWFSWTAGALPPATSTTCTAG